MESIKQIYRIGHGPSSSHTMGPMRAARMFLERNRGAVRFNVTLYGSLAATGKGHMTDAAILEVLSPVAKTNITWEPKVFLPFHPNGILFQSFDESGEELDNWTIYSIGGGTLANETYNELTQGQVYEMHTIKDIQAWCEKTGHSYWEYVEQCEGPQIWDYLAEVWEVMQQAVRNGLEAEGILPGGLGIRRKASDYMIRAKGYGSSIKSRGMVYAYALAVSEENACGGKIVTAPTCEKGGYTTHTCSVCGSSYVDTMIDALGHDYQTVVTAPTCDAMGYTTHTCTRCGNSYVDSYTQAADHSYTSEVTKQPTCTEEGVRTFTCTNCSKSYTESIPMIAHSYEEVKTEPDCTHMGYTTYTCSVCGDSYKADFVDAAGHDCEATVVVPTCEGYGYTENHCKHCDYTYISEIRQPLGHDDKLTGAKEATCTEPGYTGDMVCTRCGEVHSKGEEIPALGHDYGDWTTVKEADCFHTGLEERKCGRCGETEQRETTAETCPSEAYTDLDRNGWYHEYVDWVLKNGVMNGVGGVFEPNGETTRAMLVMVLYRMAGAPDMAGRESSFTDVSADSWYGAAVIWASENGIVNGVGGGLFDPDASLTREQMAMMLYRFAGYLGSNTEKRADLSAYGDADAVSAFAQDAMAWAVAEGLVNGRSAAELAPKAGATRAELATILFRFAALQNA